MRRICFFVFLCAINLVTSEWGFYHLYTIKNLQSDLIVDSFKYTYATLQEFSGSRSQLWELKPTDKVGQFYVTNAQTGHYLYANLTSGLHQVTATYLSFDDLDCFQWSVDSDSTIVSAHMNMALDIWTPSGASNLIGSLVTFASKTGNQTQQYVFEQQD